MILYILSLSVNAGVGYLILLATNSYYHLAGLGHSDRSLHLLESWKVLDDHFGQIDAVERACAYSLDLVQVLAEKEGVQLPGSELSYNEFFSEI